MTLNPSFADATRTADTGVSRSSGREGSTRHSADEQSGGPSHNVGETERYTSIASGAVVALFGLARRDPLGLVLAGVGGALLYRGATGNCPLYSALEINTTETEEDRRAALASRGVRVTQAFTIDKPAEELYQQWRNFENLPRIMTHLESVQVLDEKRSRWIAKAPSIAGGQVEWDAEITEDVPNERIAWRSLEGADVDNTGSVRFESSPRGTIVRVDMRYLAPAGRLGTWIAKLFGENPDTQIREDLRNFKRSMEIGEPLTILGQPHGTCSGQGKPYSENNSYLLPPSV
jgi:uncharacterized membrane protein